MTILFKAKTHDAYTIKILAELLQNNLKTACFEVDSKGIKLCMVNHHKTILIKLFMESDNFTVYKFKAKEKLFLGINLNHFHKMLKSIKKKDSMVLFIKDNAPTDLGIKVIPKENNRVTTSKIKIQGIQNIDINSPTGYGKPIIISSVDYQKMTKCMSQICNITNVTAKNFHIKFGCDDGGVIVREVDFGETGDSDVESDNDDDEIEYNQKFDTEKLSRISKMSGLGANMQIFPCQNEPLLFKSIIGSLGKISIYIKSRDTIEKEKHTECSDDREDDEDEEDSEEN